MNSGNYIDPGPTREEVESMPGVLALEFGENWCGYCRAARPHVEAALAAHPEIRHIKVMDGRGKPLGRSFRVKLWPTIVVLKDGVETARVVRPTSEQEVGAALDSCL